MGGGTSDSEGRKAAEKLAQDVQAKFKEDLFNKKENEKKADLLRQEAKFEQELMKFRNSRIHSSEGRDGKVNQETDWELAKRKGTEGSTVETTAYNSEWKIAMLGLVAMLVEWNKALNNTVTEFLMKPKFLMQHKLLPDLWDKIKSPFTSDPAVILPTLVHEVKLNDKNALEVNLTAKGREPGAPSFDDQFKRVVVEWLKEQGYRANPDPDHGDQFVDSKGDVLTPAAFDSLKNDPDHGLDHFLKETSELQFRPGM
jgi:hypothetical protein